MNDNNQELVKQLREKLLEDRKEAEEQPPPEVSEAGLERMNGPIGEELSALEAAVLLTSHLKKNIFKSPK